MIDIDLVRKNKDTVIANLAKRGVKAEHVERLLKLDEEWRAVTTELESINKAKNAINAKMAKASGEEKKQIIAEGADIGKKEKELKEQEKAVALDRETAWKKLPNLLMDDVQEGGEDDFAVLETVPETITKPAWAQKDYLTLLPDLIDMERAGKVSGSRFVYIKGQLARLEMALVSYLMDTLGEQGFTPVLPPVLIGTEAMAGMGYMDNGADEIYKTQDDLYLVGTSEQAMGPMHMNEVLSGELPRRYVGFSPSFRREAGSHGKDVKGILRLHQFDKVEMFSFTAPENSAAEHEFLLERQKVIMLALELPYRVIRLAAGDLGAPSAKTYDIETWMPSEGKYRETHSTSNTTDFQARRLNVRVKLADGSVVKAHMLNGTALAMSRIFIALIENHQQADGSIAIPQALHSYLPFTSIQGTK